MAEEEVAKLEKHLKLLRQEYVKLQKKLADTERKYNLLAAQSNRGSADDSFITRLLAIVAELYEQEQYSDLKIKVGDKRISAHKFVLAARSEAWSLANLMLTEELDLSAAPKGKLAHQHCLYSCCQLSRGGIDQHHQISHVGLQGCPAGGFLHLPTIQGIG